MCFNLLYVQNGVDIDRVGANKNENNNGCGKDDDDDYHIGYSYGGRPTCGSIAVYMYTGHIYVQGDDDDNAGGDSFYKTSFFNKPCWTRTWEPPP